jgi:hypothetical protein
MPPCRTNLSCFKETLLASPSQTPLPYSNRVSVVMLPGKDPDVRRNFQRSLDTRLWGSKNITQHSKYGQPPEKQDILIVGKDCWAPTPTEKGFRWAGREKGGKLDDFTFDALIFFRVIEDPQPARSLHWDDEIKEGRLIYNDRFHIEPLCRVNHVAASTLPGNLAQVFDATVSNTSPVTTTLSDSQLDNLADLAGEDRWIQLYNLPPDPTVDCSLNFQNPVKIYWSGPNEQSHSSSNSSSKSSSTDNSDKSSGGRQRDTLKRLATEQYAVERAKSYYKSHGWDVEVHGAPFDLKCSKEGHETILVEVKGTKESGDTVIITRGERNNAKNNYTELFIVHSIRLIPDSTVERVDKFGEKITCPTYKGESGIEKIVRNWKPSDQDLEAISYDYTVPKDLWEDPVHGNAAP